MMASSASVSVCSVAGEMILPAAHIEHSESIQGLAEQVRAVVSSAHVSLVSKSGQTMVESLSARDNGIADGDQLTAVFGKHDVLWLLPVAAKYILRCDLTAGRISPIRYESKRRNDIPFGNAVRVGSKTYFTPIDSDAMLIHDHLTDELESVDVSGFAKGEGKFSAALVADGKIYLVPGRSDKLVVFDVATSQLSGIDIRHVAGCRRKWHSARLHGDKIIAFPCNTSSFSFLHAGDLVVQDGEKFYVLPNEHNNMLIYDCDSQAVSVVEVDTFAKAPLWWGGTSVDGRLFALPKDGAYLWQYDTVFQTAAHIDFSRFGGGWSKLVNVDGVIYCAPYSCRFILEYNAKTGEIFGIDASWFTHCRRSVFADVVVLEGVLYFVPLNSESLMAYDRTQKCTYAVDLSGFTAHRSTSNWRFGVHVVEH